MYNLTMTIILFVSFIIAIHIPQMETRETLYYKPITEEKAVSSLVKIQFNQILPFVQLLKDVETFQNPENLEKVILAKGRIINGTQFTSENSTEQLFYCPKEYSDDSCLVPKEFQGLEPLQCAEESRPLYGEEPGDILCSEQDSGKSHRAFYEICPREELNENAPKRVTLYTFCYDLNIQKTIFTSHQITFPELLDSKALRPEQNIKYNMELSFGFNPSNTRQLQDALLAEQEEPDFQNADEDQKPKKHVYKAQKLIPPEDLTFASWRKSTYRFFNAELQHEELILFWNEINYYIRSQAKKMYITRKVKFSINTGVFELPSATREDGQKTNVWVKLIYVMSPNIKKPTQGMVILMDNFIDKTSQQIVSSNPAEKSVLDYCKDEYCENRLKTKIEKIGGRVRCCTISEEMKRIFRRKDNKTDASKLDSDSFDVPLLRIPGINKLQGDFRTKFDGKSKLNPMSLPKI